MAIQLPFDGFLPAHPGTETAEHVPDMSLWDYPRCSSETLNRHAKYIGMAGEHLFDSYMARFGLLSCAVAEMLPLDRLLIVGTRALRVQIKATTHAYGGTYRFSASRGYNRGPNGVRPYEPDDFDMLALAVLPENVMAFTISQRLTHGIPIGSVPALRAHPRDTLEEALRALDVPIPGEPPADYPAHPATARMEDRA